MENSDREMVAAFRTRLADERHRLVLAEAEKETLPAAGFLLTLANLDSAIAAVEAVIDEGGLGAARSHAA